MVYLSEEMEYLRNNLFKSERPSDAKIISFLIIKEVTILKMIKKGKLETEPQPDMISKKKNRIPRTKHSSKHELNEKGINIQELYK